MLFIFTVNNKTFLLDQVAAAAEAIAAGLEISSSRHFPLLFSPDKWKNGKDMFCLTFNLKRRRWRAIKGQFFGERSCSAVPNPAKYKISSFISPFIASFSGTEPSYTYFAFHGEGLS